MKTDTTKITASRMMFSIKKVALIFGRMIKLAILLLVFNTCSDSLWVSFDNYYINQSPPNGVAISENFYCDQTEMSNLGWIEYVFWTKKIFGTNSQEYQETLPDSSVWLLTEIDCLSPFVSNHLYNPKYQFNPIVGISQEQARNYTKWRSDRFFEAFLTEHKIIELDTAQTPETHFTIERFFNGELKNVASKIKVLFYPNFRLPTLEERSLILTYADSTYKANFKNCFSKKCKHCKKDFPYARCEIEPCEYGELRETPTLNVYSGCIGNQKVGIFHIRGNVGEWLDEPNLSAGGSWHDSKEMILSTDTFNIADPNAYTGFRNIFEWKKWEN